MCRKAKADFERSLSLEAKTNPKAFYKYVNSKLKTKSTIPNLVVNGDTLTSDAQKANALNSFFCSVFTRENLRDMPHFELPREMPTLSELTITEDMVYKKIQKLKANKSPGPDGVHPRVLKELAAVISKPLSILMQTSLNQRKLPLDWKHANVSPIFKKGKKSICTNYRPVSLTSVICKIMEAIIRDHITAHISAHKCLQQCQHGFTEGRSCATQLLRCLDIWTGMLDQGLPVDTIYLDFSKAFDSVPHQRLLQKLKAYGIRGSIHEWLQDFLTGRSQRVAINGTKSSWGEVLSGVPQGSVIGPLLFILFVNDMPDAVHCGIQMFADDTKIYRSVSTLHDHEDFQHDLDNLCHWADTWQMAFNSGKCKVLHIGSRNPGFDYSMQGDTLEAVVSEKDLGVTVDHQLKFDQHIENQVNKANKILGLIRRSFNFMDKDILTNLYKTLVRPHLEYCHAVTYPQFERQWKSIESVQHRATKLLSELRNLPYEQRLQRLDLPSMRYRFVRGDMIEVYKYTHHLYLTDHPPLPPAATDQSTRGHSFKLSKIRCNTTQRQKFFAPRIVNLWNSLTEDIVTSPTINTFKNRLDKFWKEKRYMQ